MALLRSKSRWIISLTAVTAVASFAFPAFPPRPSKSIRRSKKHRLISIPKRPRTGHGKKRSARACGDEGGKKLDVKLTDLKGRQWGGLTAIATYALVASGENPQDAELKPAIDFLPERIFRARMALVSAPRSGT